MTQLFREGKNWLIISQLADLTDIKEMLKDVDKHNYADFTSAKGRNSVQHYIMPANWMPRDDHRYPKGWEEVKEKYAMIVQRELINYGLMPFNWKKIYAKSAWTVKGQEGSYHTIHEHGPSSISTIIYTEVPKKSIEDAPYTTGSVYFVLDGNSYVDTAVPASRVMHVNPHEGMLIIFPSYLLHGVYPQGPGLRQTLNVDYHGDPNWTYGLGTAGTSNFN
jgi:hypothetical protein